MSQYNYKGYSYERYEDTEYDADGQAENIKIYHFVKTPLGSREISLDWSPYEELTEAQFRQFIELGLPDRTALRDSGGPLDQEELDELSRRQQEKITEEVRSALLSDLRRLQKEGKPIPEEFVKRTLGINVTEG